MSGGRWRFWIDRGGTFTDLVGRAPDGRFVVRKVLSEAPPPPDGGAAVDPAIRAIREALGLPADAPLADRVEEVRLGTTVATNALLERQVEPVLLFLNRGLADLPLIGDQHRPDLFALRIERPPPLPLRLLEVDGRLAADGREVEPLRLDQALESQVRQAVEQGWRCAAVALLHSYRHPDQERRLGEWLQGLGLSTVLLSHQLSRQPRLVPRSATTVIEAALRPCLFGYLEQVRQALGPGTRLRVMTSGGALQAPSLLHAKDTILSGPAGGMVGAVAVARSAGLADGPILGFDMGGTSTDVFHFDGSRGEAAWERSSETEISGLRLQAPMLPIHTVAAGGGSVLHVDGGRLQVGPRSAGADPGPACYRRGGPLTLTDANLLLGRLPLDALPPVFGPDGRQGADREVVVRQFTAMARQLEAVSIEALAQGALAIAIERMAEAIRRISIQRGHDLRRAVLVTFGSAGGQVTCPLAACLGIDRVLLHPLAGVLSAYGIGRSPQSVLRERTLRCRLSAAVIPTLAENLERLLAEARRALRESGDLREDQSPRERVRLELRVPGSERGLEIAAPPTLPATDPEAARRLVQQLVAAFASRHRQRFGYVVEGEDLVVERLQVEVSSGESATEADPGAAADSGSPAGAAAPQQQSAATVPLCLPQGPPASAGSDRTMAWHTVPLLQRRWLRPGQRLQGPAVVVEPTGTTVLEPGWSAEVLADGALLLRRDQAPIDGLAAPRPAAAATPRADPAVVDPVRLELYNHRFGAIAEQMGERLRQSSRSVNIRERLDFSCAVFDGRGALVANAPHIPVHLGSMGESVAALLADVDGGRRPPLRPGDAYAANDPFHGGTHLPDITVISPVFAPGRPSDPAAAEQPLFFVASRGHHADVGGITPGSMPPFSHRIEEEGLLLENVPLLQDGRFAEASWRDRLRQGPHPVRDPQRLLADLQAQIAANRLGEQELGRLLERDGVEEVRRYMGHVQANAAEAVRRVIDRLDDGSHAVELDDGARLQVTVRIDRAARRARLDFSGTSPQQPGNVNAPLAITKAVVLYVFRCLVGQAIPLNAGCFQPLELHVPEGCLLHPLPPAAVVAGNVETSQALANALFAALGVMAAAQGTMNNLSFGDDRRQYYETICGGTGAGVDAAGQGFDGASAVHSHMTNSRLTDPEILEDRLPVRLERFALRRGSGGRGRWRGGDGVVRSLRFLEPMTVALLSGSRRVPPFGLAGGEAGRCGSNRLERADGTQLPLAGCDEVAVEPGDCLTIETPGGGGFGSPPPAATSER